MFFFFSRLIDVIVPFLQALLARSKTSSSDAAFSSDLKAFSAQRKVEQRLANAVAFQYDLTSLVRDLNAFGTGQLDSVFSPAPCNSPIPSCLIAHCLCLFQVK